EFDTITVRAKFKTLRIRLTSLLKIAIENGLLIVDSSSPSVSTKMTELSELFTESPRKASKTATKAVKEDIEYLRFEKLTAIEKKHVEVEEAIFDIILKINNK